MEHNCNYLSFDDDYLNKCLKHLVVMHADDTILPCDSEYRMKDTLVALYNYCEG